MIYIITCLHKPCKLTKHNFFCPSTLDVSIIRSLRISVLLRVIAVGAIINCNINRFRLEGKHKICGFLGKLTCPHDAADWPTLQYNDNDNNRQQKFIQLKNLMRSKLLTQASISCKNTQCLFGYVNRFASYCRDFVKKNYGIRWPSLHPLSCLKTGHLYGMYIINSHTWEIRRVLHRRFARILTSM